MLFTKLNLNIVHCYLQKINISSKLHSSLQFFSNELLNYLFFGFQVILKTYTHKIILYIWYTSKIKNLLTGIWCIRIYWSIRTNTPLYRSAAVENTIFSLLNIQLCAIMLL